MPANDAPAEATWYWIWRGPLQKLPVTESDLVLEPPN
jgi:hypothetical protein